MALSPAQHDLLNRVAVGGQLRFEVGIGHHIVGQPGTYRNVTVKRLVGLGLLAEQPHDPEAVLVDFDITPAGFEALGIKEVAAADITEEPTEAALAAILAELARLMDTPPGADKPITPLVYVPGIGLLPLPRMSAENEAALLRNVRTRVPEFGNRPGMFEAGVLEYEAATVLLLADSTEDTYAAIFCDTPDQAASLLTNITAELGTDLAEAQYFPADQAGEGETA